MSNCPSCGKPIYRLLGAGGKFYYSHEPGKFGGHVGQKIYGRMECESANRALTRSNTYALNRVFFANETDAQAAGFRPCAKCMPADYAKWIKGGTLGSAEYPWLILPK